MNVEADQSNLDLQHVSVGEALRQVRRRLQWSTEMAAVQLQISKRHLDQIEAGIRTPSDELLEEIGACYGIEPERLRKRVVAERVPPRFDADSNTLWLGWLPIQLELSGNEGLLCSIGAALRAMRSLSEESPVYLRSDEFAVLAPLFDLDDPQLGFLMMRHLRVSWTESCELVEGLRAVETPTGVRRDQAAGEPPVVDMAPCDRLALMAVNP